MTLVFKNKLNLDTNINDLMTDWQFNYGDFQKPATLRQILSHSAGLNVGGFIGYPSEDSLPSLTEIIEGTAPANSPAVQLIEEPGTKFMYSGGGYQIMQKVPEDRSGKSFPEMMEENVFQPLGMINSCYAPLDSANKANAAYGHTSESYIPDYGPIHVESAAGGLWTTPSDLALMFKLLQTHQQCILKGQA